MKSANNTLILTLAFLILGFFFPEQAHSVRLKDIANFGGVRTNQLVGYGLVVGLSGTGDRRSDQATVRSVVNMLESMGVSVDRGNLQFRNVAAVIVTADMPASARSGSRLDVTISSIGDANSLQGGVLIQTPLKGIDGEIYALAQGPLTLGGFSVEGQAAQVTTNITTVGRIPNGAMVEREIPFRFNSQESIQVNLNVHDFSTTSQVMESINASFGQNLAAAKDISTIRVNIPSQFRGNLIPFMAALENIQVSPDSPAKVVVDEKTGTVVIGENVRISRVAVSHGDLNIIVREQPQVFMPAPFTEADPVVVPDTDIAVIEEERQLVVIEGATINELVEGLNSIGATPRDLITILRTIKAAGALYADLEVI
ncbi:flagellar basal body P-ring protein FlgI [Desulfonatronovibrio hydrogenovorans]|uniref:flagellar basal body P-ring protein FlgI n=1 Tax=Desulfonatronovibrio hydrogenovorans TaxID=53245 RepID=UPI00048BB3CF|nr:flagellar basal body P-ring protein FlgI [Desulfonatronovibrio hydrogenovorans]